MELFPLELKSVNFYEYIYSIEMEQNTVLHAVVYVNTTHLQHTLCAVLL